MSNNQLPDEVRERIKTDAAKSTNKRNESLRYQSKDYGRRISFIDGYEQGYVAGATTEFIKLHEAQQENEKLKAIANLWRPLMEEVVKRFEGVAEMADQDYDLNLIKQIKRFLYGE